MFSSCLADISEPSLVLIDSMKVKVIFAACVPVVLFLLLSITAVIIICVVVRYKRKKAELHFKETVAKEPRKTVEVLSKTVPKSMYPEFLEFAERILSGACEVCQKQHSSEEPNGERRGKEIEGEEDFDGVAPEEGVYGDEMMLIMQAQDRDVSSRMLSSMAKIMQSGLDNRKIGGQLSSIMMSMLAARGVPAPLPVVSVVGESSARSPVGAIGTGAPMVSPLHDLGYSGSNSGSTHSESKA